MIDALKMVWHLVIALALCQMELLTHRDRELFGSNEDENRLCLEVLRLLLQKNKQCSPFNCRYHILQT